MKNKILSTLVLVSMMFSIFIGDPLLLKASAEPEPEPIPPVLGVDIYENGELIDFRYHQWLRPKDTKPEVTFASLEGAEIYYTLSTQQKGGTTVFSNTMTKPETTDIGRSKERFSAPQILNRHDGGGSPINADRTGPSEGAIKYTGSPVIVDLPENRSAFTISVIAVKDGKACDPVTMSWIRASEGTLQEWRDNDYMIISLTSDPVGLYGFEDGIMIAGKQRYEWAKVFSGLASAPGNNGEPRKCVCPKPTAKHQEDPYWGDDTATGHEDQACFSPTTVANFFMRGKGAERAAFVEMFDAHGARQIAQGAGLRIKGGWSRGTYVNDQKTFEVYGRKGYNEYDAGGENTFIFPLFGNVNTIDQTGNIQHRYRRFRIRNGGSDRERAYLRDELSASLWRQAGFENTQHHRPAVVFLNGGYYGLAWLKTPRTELAWANLYGGNEEQFHCLGSSELGKKGCARTGCDRVMPGQEAKSITSPLRCNGSSRKCTTEMAADNPAKYTNRYEECLAMQSSPDTLCGGETSTKCRAIDDWAHVREILLGTGDEKGYDNPPNGVDAGNKIQVRVDENGRPTELTRLPAVKTVEMEAFEYFCLLVDIDNLVQYFATQMYVGNCDWPTNNFEMYRYYPTTEELENPNLHPILDGRWRMGAFDLEYGFGLWGHNEDSGQITGTLPHFNTIQALLNRRSVPTGKEGYGIGHFGAKPSAITFQSLTRRSDVRTKFANAFYDLMEGAFEPKNSLSVFEQLLGAISTEHQLTLPNGDKTSVFRRIDELGRGGLNLQGQIYWPMWEPNADKSNITDDHNQIRNFLEKRPAEIKKHIGNSYVQNLTDPSKTNGLGLPDTSRNLVINLSVGDKGHVKLNNRYFGMNNPERTPAVLKTQDPRTAKGVNAKYFSDPDAPVTVVATPWPGYIVKWPDDVPLYADPADPNNPNRRLIHEAGTHTISVTFVECPGCKTNYTFDVCEVCGAGDTNGANGVIIPGNLDITAIRTSIEPGRSETWTGNRQSDKCTGFVEITNRTDKPFSTKGMFLSSRNNNNSSLDKMRDFQLPALIIQPGESIYLNTRHNNNVKAGVWDQDFETYLNYKPSATVQRNGKGYFTKRSNTDFNIDFGDRLRLINYGGKIQTMIDVTRLTGTQVMERQTDGNFKVVGEPLLGPPPATCKTCGEFVSKCKCPCPGCGEYISACICQPILISEGGKGEVDVLSIERDGQEWMNNRQIPVYNVTVRVTAITDLKDWKATTGVPTGTANHSQNQNNTRGFESTLTDGVYTFWRKDMGNNDNFNFIESGESQEFSFKLVFSTVDPDETGEVYFIRPRPCPNGCGKTIFNCTCCEFCGMTPCICEPCTKGATGCGRLPKDGCICHKVCQQTPCVCPPCETCGNAPCTCICAECGNAPDDCVCCEVCGFAPERCTCGPRAIETSSGVTVSTIKEGGGAMNLPESITVSGSFGSNGESGRYFTISFPYKVAELNHWNATSTKINDTTWKIELPNWWGENSIDIGIRKG